MKQCLKIIELSAVTLLELCVTILIIAILISIAEVTLGDSTRYQNLKSSIQQLTYAVRSAKYNAKLKGEQTTVQLNKNSSNYDINANGNSLIGKNNLDAFSGTLPGNVLIISNLCGSINFSANGDVTDSSGNTMNNCQITLGYAGGPVQNLTFKPSTGELE